MKNGSKNGSLIGRPALFLLALVSFYLTFSPSLYALTPEQVSNFSAAEKFVYTAYFRALAYFPERVADGLQRRLGLWAYDPQGHSVYGTFNVTIQRGTSPLGLSTIWYNSPYVNSVPGGSCGAHGLGSAGFDASNSWDGYAWNQTCYEVTWTRGAQGSLGGSVSCSGYSYKRYADFPEGGGCGNYSESCVTGGNGYTWNEGRYQLSGSWYSMAGGTIYNKWIVPSCAPVVPVDEFSSWISAPLSNAILGDTADIVKTLQDAKGVPGLTPADSSDINAALSYLHNGVQVSNGAIPEVSNPVPQDIWDFTSSGTIVGGGGGSVVVATTVITVDIEPVTNAVNSLSPKLDDIGTKLMGINDYLVNPDTSPSQGHYNAVQTAFNGLLTSISSMPVMGAMNSLLPQDTSSQWEPCFDLSFAWSGVFAGSRPAAYTGNYCLNSFSGWDTFVNLIRWGFSLGVMVWGVRYLWGGY